MAQLRPGDLADCAWAFAHLRYQPSEPWERDAVRRVGAVLPDFTPQQLGVLLWGWRSVQLHVPDRWQDVFAAASDALLAAGQRRDLAAVGVLPAPASNSAA